MDKKIFLNAATFTIGLAFGTSLYAQKQKKAIAGGAPMYPSKNIVENDVNSKDHTSLVAAVKVANLVETLQSKEPFTVFAPTHAAFDKLI
jgi:uncharacterized surface protein with fasciclin (FAS1) repeats